MTGLSAMIWEQNQMHDHVGRFGHPLMGQAGLLDHNETVPERAQCRTARLPTHQGGNA
jgi:hypothetical protein